MTDFYQSTFAAVFVGFACYVIYYATTFLDTHREERKVGSESKKTLDSRWRQWKGQKFPSIDSYEEMLLSSIVLPTDVDVGFSDIGGLQKMKDAVEEVLLALNFTHQRSKLLNPPRGVLFYGPPGTGKTMSAKAIAKECGATFIQVRLSNLQDKYFGESQKLIRGLFSLSKKLAPTIIFIDEIDAFLRKRSINDHDITATMKAEFMSLWDGLSTADSCRVIVLGASNRPRDIDQAILRRLPRQLYFGLPDEKERHLILQAILKDERRDADVDLLKLASNTSNYSGSDLRELCRKAVVIPFRECMKSQKEETTTITPSFIETPSSNQKNLRPLNMKDFDEALKEIRATGDVADEYFYSELAREEKKR